MSDLTYRLTLGTGLEGDPMQGVRVELKAGRVFLAVQNLRDVVGVTPRDEEGNELPGSKLRPDTIARLDRDDVKDLIRALNIVLQALGKPYALGETEEAAP